LLSLSSSKESKNNLKTIIMDNENTVRIGEGSMAGAVASGLWKKVTLGTTSGILLGAGAIQGVNHIKDNEEEAGAEAENNAEAEVPVYADAPVAHVSDSMSFDQAFATARAEVGPGGVFAWHGGIYGTYYETEWDAMSDAQKLAYAESVNPEVTPQHIRVNLINEAHPDVVVDVRATDAHGGQAHYTDEPHAATGRTAAEQDAIADDDDVHIVGQGEVQGHSAVALDMTGNGDADVVIIDADDSLSLNEPDVVVFRDGTATTVGDIAEGNPPVSLIGEEHQAYMENPDVAPDMPDYMDDASIPT